MSAFMLRSMLNRPAIRKQISINRSVALINRCSSSEISAGNDIPEEGFQSPILSQLSQRGFIHQCTNYRGLDKLLASKNVSLYLGFDATATSLHVGSLIQLMILRAFQKAGHKPVVVIGGGTTKIGDPSGKDSARQMLTEEAISKNVDGICSIFKKYLVFGDGPSDAVLVNNNDWLGSLNYLEFLRDVGSHFSINRMLTFDSVKQRLERLQPLSFLEFNYLILQAYDFVELNKRYDVRLQLGGSDQWGNIVSGTELGRKIGIKHSLFGLTTPLLVNSDGSKMGKSVNGAVWLDKELLSEFDYWQFWRNTPDADVIKYLMLFTEVPTEKILHMKETLSGAGLNAAKILLADEATRLLHGDSCLTSIHQTASGLFGESDNGSKKELSSLPVVQITNAAFTDGQIGVINLFMMASLGKSKNELRTLISAGGLRINDNAIADEKVYITPANFDSEGKLKLTRGKKNHVIIQLVN